MFVKVYLGKNVVVKVVGKEKVIRVGMMNQIKREISGMKMVKHPNIVELRSITPWSLFDEENYSPEFLKVVGIIFNN